MDMTEKLDAGRAEAQFLLEPGTREVLECLRGGPASDVDVKGRTQFSRNTVKNRLGRLEALGIVARVGTRRAPGRGQAQRLWALTGSVEIVDAWLRGADALVLDLLGRRAAAQDAEIADRRREDITAAASSRSAAG